jgi:hypothetical protein
MGYSTPAINSVWERVHEAIPSTQLGGIYGNKPGYHNCRANLPSSDYSVQKPDDKKGDAQAGAGLDLTFPNNEDEKRLMKRLMDAGRAGDPRVHNLRECFGTVDGQNVTGWDFRGMYPVTSDDSHLWHIHISWYRLFATDQKTADDVVSVLLGDEYEADDMNKDDTRAEIAAALRNYHLGSDGSGHWTNENYPNVIKDEKNGVGDRLTRLEKK